MKLSGEKILGAPQARVWAALNDPDVLRQSIPGCESFQKQDDGSYRAVVATKIGPVQARFNGTVRLSDLDPPNGYTISGEGSGGAAGSARGGAKVRLEPAEAGGTRLSWTADAQVSGKLAQIGSRLIESTANHMAGQFFDRFGQIIAGQEPPAASAGAMLPPWIWWAAGGGAALVVLIVVLLLV
jgi:carbon monoxide dehydrogenase subunit G